MKARVTVHLTPRLRKALAFRLGLWPSDVTEEVFQAWATRKLDGQIARVQQAYDDHLADPGAKEQKR